MTRRTFPLYQSHLDLAHSFWKKMDLSNSDVIDATCGNGHDTTVLMELTAPDGTVLAMDIQQQSIENTRQKIDTQFSAGEQKRISYFHGCHSTFPETILEESVHLIVYNLGYLPGSDKETKTKVATTLQSLSNARKLIKRGGVISITCYPGHLEGAEEEEAILQEAAAWSPQEWSCTHTRWLNRFRSPLLILLQRSG